MFIQVRLLKGFTKPLLYKLPDDWPQANLVGHIVHVPIQKRTEHAIVVKQYSQKPTDSNFEIRHAISVDPLPQDLHYQTFIQKLSTYYQLEPIHFFRRIRGFLEQEKRAVRQASSFAKASPRLCSGQALDKHDEPINDVTLTKEQQTVTDFVIKNILSSCYTPTVLHGVTGSGKTECYKKMIVAALAQNKTTLLMLPEVTLALQFEQLLRAQLPNTITIFGFHSATTARDKKLLWKQLLQGKPLLIIGVHLPILLPIANPGLIIVDEEHETGYGEKKHPKINSKEAALIRAHICRIPIVLGSATPSISSLYNIKKRGWHFFQLKKRFSGTFPKIKTIFLSDKKFRRNFWISQKLENAIRDRLQKKEQTIIFLNRRGFSFFVQCKECGFIFECPNCSVSLTLHNNNALACHYCEHAQIFSDDCPECKTKKTKFIKKGIGTQQVVTILEKLFPHARIGRADMDTTRKKKLWQTTLKAFEEKRLDILVGTQTITKGFHFPGVTLVGILWADLNLHFPVYNATETTLQQLIQVAGRAGRQSQESTVIVQAMGDHPVFQYLNEIDYLKFYTDETNKRSFLHYPPHGRLAEIELKHTDEQLIEQESTKLALFLTSEAKKRSLSVTVLGPAKPPVSKVKRTHIRKIYLKSPHRNAIEQLFSAISPLNLLSKTFYTPNPAQ